MVAYERNQRQNNPDYLPLLRQEIMAVIKKYVHVDSEQIKVELNQDQDRSVLELNIMLPPEEEEKNKEANNAQEKSTKTTDEALS
ncbi:cell division topological specificity factor MinE [Piscirickettsia litoralis]